MSHAQRKLLTAAALVAIVAAGACTVYTEDLLVEAGDAEGTGGSPGLGGAGPSMGGEVGTGGAGLGGSGFGGSGGASSGGTGGGAGGPVGGSGGTGGAASGGQPGGGGTQTGGTGGDVSGGGTGGGTGGDGTGGGTGGDGTGGDNTGGDGSGGDGAGGDGAGGGGTGGDGAGGAETGGTGTGGSDCPDPASGTLVLDVIDDMEDGNNRIPEEGTPVRAGVWYDYDDGTGTTNNDLPSATEITDRTGSSYAIWMSASGTTSYGAGIGVDLNNDTSKLPYDASGYDGITFWAKGSVTGGSVRFKALIHSIVPPSEDGGCAEGDDCNNGHGVNLSGLSDEWQQFTFTFCDLSQESWGYRVDFDSSEILTLQFQGNDGVDFEIWIDDLAFFTVE